MSHTLSRFETFRSDERGTIAIMFALSLTSVMMLIGCAVDYARILHARSKMIAAADVASLAAARSLRETSATAAEIATLARKYFDENMTGSGNYATLTSFTATPNGGRTAVTIDIKADMPTSFMRIGGITSVNLPITSTAVYDKKDIEVGLQLDVTGSMCSPCSKINDLKAATKDLLDILMPDGGTPNSVRVGLAPFSAGVNAGSYASAVAGASPPGNCVYERLSTANETTDAYPSGSDRFRTRYDLGPSANPCPSGAVVQALTSNKSALKTAVDAMTPGGSTAGHLGTAWAWYLISPNWSSVWPSASKPAAYADLGTVKTAVLMTDGEYNTYYGDSNGAAQTKSQARAKALCANMRAQNIVIYTVGFKIGGNAAAVDVLNSCAGAPGRFFSADNGDELRAAFRTIAQNISRLRLTN
ncbi:MAG: pilus assembly protein [Hyphomicrobiales bacterium]|nr:pilus assembly protein [Hyphomicrobiales bacterium]